MRYEAANRLTSLDISEAGFAAIIEKAQRGPDVIVVLDNDVVNQDEFHPPGTRDNRTTKPVIIWAPDKNLTWEGGHYVDSAVVLYHELGHYLNWAYERKGYADRKAKKCDQYDNKEEAHVIQWYEHQLAFALGYHQRPHHRGSLVTAKQPWRQ